MTSSKIVTITSRDNSFYKELRALAQESTHYRQSGRFWVEGDHLCEAALHRGWSPTVAVFSDTGWASPLRHMIPATSKVVRLSDQHFAAISSIASSTQMGFLFDLPVSPGMQLDIPTVVLDRVQDPGNVGSILRSAAAFGFMQILALKGSAALWGPKVLRAGMGAHFGLQLIEGVSPVELKSLQVPILVTSSHDGQLIRQQKLPWSCAWVFGHEGQGVQQLLASLAQLSVRIDQPGGEESLNVAAAAAICLYASIQNTT